MKNERKTKRTLLSVILAVSLFVVFLCAHFAMNMGFFTSGSHNNPTVVHAFVAIAFATTIAMVVSAVVSVQRKKTIDKLIEHENRSSYLRNMTETAIIEYDVKTNKRIYSENLENNFKGDYSADEGLADIWLKNGIIDKSDYKTFVDFVEAVLKKTSKGSPPKNETHYLKLKTTSGATEWYRVEASYVERYSRKADRVIVTITNINEDMQQREQLRYQAEFDSVAGIYNKHTFFSRTGELISKHPNIDYTIVRFDIDRFKVFNDLFGVETGDGLLRTIGAKMKSVMPSSVTYGYLGSDHFVMCIPTEDLDINVLINDISIFLREQPYNFTIQPRFGIYEIVDRTTSIELMCDRALLALRSIKGSYHKPYAVYDERLRRELLFEQQIVNEMSSALTEKQFAIYLQPQYSHKTGKIVSAEALVRWNHPTLGVIPPSVFIPLFEKNGFISQMDKYVWEEACRCMRRWLDENIRPISLSVSVNISRMDIYDTELCGTLLDLVERYGLPPSMLKLEITETAYVENPVQLIDVVKKLRDKGFIIQMDDFGSGYSSLNTLKDVPVDVLKLDLKFLAGEENVERGGMILNSVVRMAQWLNLEVIAEGVETVQQANYLQSIGCDLVQGYLYSKPISIPEFEELIKSADVEHKKPLSGMDVIIDTNEFWNPNAQTSLVFQSFLSGAAIIEQFGNVYECTRKNAKFCEAADVSEETFNRFQTRLMDFVFDDDVEMFKGFFAEAAETRTENECECRFKHPSAPEKGLVYLKVRTRLIARSETRNVFYLSVENISNEKHQEKINEQQAKALEKHSQFIQTVYSSVPYGVMQYTYEKKPKIVDFNEACYKIFGYKTCNDMRTVLEDDVFKLIFPDDRNILVEAYNQCSLTGKPVEFQIRIVKANGSIGYCHLTLDVIELPDGTRYYQCAFINITDQVLAQRELTINQYSSVLLAIFDEVKEINFNSDTITLISANKSVNDDFEEIQHDVKKALRDWGERRVHPEDRQRYDEAIAILKKGRPSNGASTLPVTELRMLGADDKYFWISVSLIEVSDGVYLLCIMNIQERKDVIAFFSEKQEMEAIQRAQERYRIIVDETGTTVLEWDLVNKTFYHSMSYFDYDFCRLGEALFKNDDYLECIHPDDRAKLKEHLTMHLRKKDRHEIVVRLKMATGEYNWCRVTGVYVYGENGKISRIIGTVSNVDDEVNIKNSLERTTENLNNIISNLPVGFCIYKIEDEKPSSIYASAQACELMGYSKTEYYKIISAGRAVLFEQNKLLINEVLKSIDGSKTFECEFQIIRHNTGEKRWIRVLGSTAVNADGEVDCYLTITDITETVIGEQQTRWQEERYRILAQTTHAVTFDYDPEKDKLTYWLYLPKRGYVERGICPYSNYILRTSTIHSDYKEGLYQLLKQASSTAVQGSYDLLAENFGTGFFWFRIYYVSVLGGDGAVYRIVGRVDSIQREKEAEMEVMEGRIYRRAITANTLLVFEFNLTTDEMAVLSDDENVAIEYFEWEKYIDRKEEGRYVHPDDYERNKEKFNKQTLLSNFNSGIVNYSIQYRIRKRDDSYVWVNTKLHLTSDFGDNEIKGIAYLQSIDEKKRSEDALRQKAERDSVTGAYNRATTEELVASSLNEDETSSVFVIFDIDNFKGLNDTYGHPEGDRSLKFVSDAILRSCRKTDIVGRLGGDEFVAYLRGAKLEEAKRTIERIFNKVRDSSEEINPDIRLSLSAGVAVTKAGDDNTFLEVFKRADKALYEAKRNGKDQYCVF